MKAMKSITPAMDTIIDVAVIAILPRGKALMTPVGSSKKLTHRKYLRCGTSTLERNRNLLSYQIQLPCKPGEYLHLIVHDGHSEPIIYLQPQGLND